MLKLDAVSSGRLECDVVINRSGGFTMATSQAVPHAREASVCEEIPTRSREIICRQIQSADPSLQCQLIAVRQIER